MGNFNATVGNLKIEEFTRAFGEETCNNNENRIIDFVVYNQTESYDHNF